MPLVTVWRTPWSFLSMLCSSCWNSSVPNAIVLASFEWDFSIYVYEINRSGFLTCLRICISVSVYKDEFVTSLSTIVVQSPPSDRMTPTDEKFEENLENWIDPQNYSLRIYEFLKCSVVFSSLSFVLWLTTQHNHCLSCVQASTVLKRIFFSIGLCTMGSRSACCCTQSLGLPECENEFPGGNVASLFEVHTYFSAWLVKGLKLPREQTS